MDVPYTCVCDIGLRPLLGLWPCNVSKVQQGWHRTGYMCDSLRWRGMIEYVLRTIPISFLSGSLIPMLPSTLEPQIPSPISYLRG